MAAQQSVLAAEVERLLDVVSGDARREDDV
jgi:hypothetical protein